MANTHFYTIEEEAEEDQESSDVQHAALAIRTTYSQALETLFALLCAAIQAPYCVPLWIDAYRNPELYNVVEKIHQHRRIHSILDTERVTWAKVADYIFSRFILDDMEQRDAIVQTFAQLWQHLAHEFLEENTRKEYNSIKHGLRIRSGGFGFAIGPQPEPGVPAPKEKMMLLGRSKFGTSYLSSEKVEDLKNHFYLTRHRRNWNPEDMGWALQLIVLSINNIQCALKAVNGSKEACEFLYP